MAKVTLKRTFYGPDGRLYQRATSDGRVIVHNLPDDWTLPAETKTVSASAATSAAAPKVEPETLTALQDAERAPKSAAKS